MAPDFVMIRIAKALAVRVDQAKPVGVSRNEFVRRAVEAALEGTVRTQPVPPPALASPQVSTSESALGEASSRPEGRGGRGRGDRLAPAPAHVPPAISASPRASDSEAASGGPDRSSRGSSASPAPSRALSSAQARAGVKPIKREGEK